MLGSKSDATDKYVSNETEEGTMEEPPFMKDIVMICRFNQ